jgi:hypothetical protein
MKIQEIGLGKLFNSCINQLSATFWRQKINWLASSYHPKNISYVYRVPLSRLVATTASTLTNLPSVSNWDTFTRIGHQNPWLQVMCLVILPRWRIIPAPRDFEQHGAQGWMTPILPNLIFDKNWHCQRYRLQTRRQTAAKTSSPNLVDCFDGSWM